MGYSRDMAGPVVAHEPSNVDRVFRMRIRNLERTNQELVDENAFLRRRVAAYEAAARSSWRGLLAAFVGALRQMNGAAESTVLYLKLSQAAAELGMPKAYIRALCLEYGLTARAYVVSNKRWLVNPANFLDELTAKRSGHVSNTSSSEPPTAPEPAYGSVREWLEKSFG